MIYTRQGLKQLNIAVSSVTGGNCFTLGVFKTCSYRCHRPGSQRRSTWLRCSGMCRCECSHQRPAPCRPAAPLSGGSGRSHSLPASTCTGTRTCTQERGKREKHSLVRHPLGLQRSPVSAVEFVGGWPSAGIGTCERSNRHRGRCRSVCVWPPDLTRLPQQIHKHNQFLRFWAFMDHRDVFNMQVLEQANTSEFKSPPEQMPTMLHNVCVCECVLRVFVCVHMWMYVKRAIWPQASWGQASCNIPPF